MSTYKTKQGGRQQQSFPQSQDMNNGNYADFNTIFNQKVVPPALGAQQYIDAHNLGYPEKIGSELGFSGSDTAIATKEVFISSSGRNWDTYEPGDYLIYLNDALMNVTRIELVGGTIPASGYTMNSTNNKIYFQETDGTTLTATVTPGNYTTSTLPAAIKAALEAAGGNTYTVTIDPATGLVTIASSGGFFSLIFQNGTEYVSDSGSARNKYQANSIGPVIGFKPDDKTGSTSYTGTYVYSLNSPPYLAIHVSCGGKDFNKITSPITAAKNAFAIVWFDANQGNYNIYNPNVTDNGNFYFDFNPPLGKLDRLHITFRNPDNSVYDFNGIDNTLIFEVATALGKEKITFAGQRR